jgi:Fe-S cluster biogenesis protein NfuA
MTMETKEETSFEGRLEDCLTMIRPFLQADGGDVRIREFLPETGVLKLQWEGTCAICPMSQLTLRAGVERALLNALPEVKRVEAISVSEK